MAAIELENPVEQQPRGIGVPEIVRWKTEQHRQYTQRITVDARDLKGKFGKVNGFRLTLEKGNDWFPAQEVDEICENIMWCVDSAYAMRKAEKDDLAELEFKVTFDQRRPDGKRARPSVEFDYNPEGPDMTGGAKNSSDEVKDATVTALLDLARSLTTHLDNAHLRIIESNKGADAVLKPLIDMLQMMGSSYTAGMEMQRRAMDFMYNTRRIEEEAAAADRRQERLLKFFDKPFRIGFAQLAKVLGKKMKAAGVNLEDAGVTEGDGDDAQTSAEGQADDSVGKPAMGGNDTQAEVRHPAAEILRSFGMLILPGQWPQIMGVLTKRQQQVFTRMFEQETDREALAAWQAIEEGAIPVTKLIELDAFLSEGQREHFEQVKQIMTAVAEAGFAADGSMSR